MKLFGIACQSAIHMRATASHSSEMVSQLLFGETVQISREVDSWYFVKKTEDPTHGWIPKKQIQIISLKDLREIQNEKPQYYTQTPYSLIVNVQTARSVVLSMGSRLPLYANQRCQLGNKKFIYTSLPLETSNLNLEKKRELILRLGKQMLDTPYLWGGKTFMGIDCSGFTQMLFKCVGVYLEHSASKQALKGKNIDYLHEARSGDLLFFDEEQEYLTLEDSETHKSISHVGIYMGKSQVLHASGEVRIDEIDMQGIYRKDLHCYTHNLRLIKRILR